MAKKRIPVATEDVLKDALNPVVSNEKKVRPEPKQVPQEEEKEAALPESVVIEIPVGPVDRGYLSRHIDARLKSDQQKQGLRRLFRGLQLAEERLEDGSPVKSNADAVRWFLEQI